MLFRSYRRAEDIRYNQRGSSERVNGSLKDNYGGRHVRVRGAASWLRVLIDNYWLDSANALLFDGMRRRLPK